MELAIAESNRYEPGFLPYLRGDLARIREKIEEVMAAFDMLCEAAGEEPGFALAFRVLDAPRLVQYELEDCLDGLPWKA
jgi:hypothetical protein